jgi:hypothetical protein
MKTKICILICLQLTGIACFSQNQFSKLPQKYQDRLVSIRKELTERLDSCRIRQGNLNFRLLMGYFNDGDMYINKERDRAIAKLNMSWDMVIDDYMINRMIQLLKNEYRKEEFDTLVNRQWGRYDEDSFNGIAFYLMKQENSKLFKQTQDSLNRSRDKSIHPDLYQICDVGEYLKWDTTPRFHFLIDSLKIAKKEEIKNYYLNKYHFDIKGLIQSCGFIGDSRLKETMLNLLDQCEKRLAFLNKEMEILKNKEQTEITYSYQNEIYEKGRMINFLYISLIQMRVEPYYTHFFKIKWGCPTANYCIDYIDNDAIILFHNQEILLAVADGLLDTSPAYITSEGPSGIVYEATFGRIKQYIENESFWKIINNPKFNLDKDRFKIYDWMKKNYGKYKIKRIW